VNRTDGPNGQLAVVGSYGISAEVLTVAPDATHAAGTTGSMLLTYLVSPPTVTGSATGANGLWFGTWNLRSWNTTGTAPGNDYQAVGLDLSTLSNPTDFQVSVPFIFGTPLVLREATEIGIAWQATGTGPVIANAEFDPFQELTGISVFDSTNTQLATFSLTDDIGNTFGTDGFVAPEPATCGLTGLALMLIVMLRRRSPMRSAAS
jgi:hypothetical protein